MLYLLVRLRLLLIFGCAVISFHAHAWSTKSTYAADAYFSENSAALTHEPSIRKLHDIVQRVALIRLEVFIAVGHADATERNPTKLSRDRAVEIKRLLVEMGVESNQISVEGKGATQSISRSLNENRRVEIEAVGTISRQIPQNELTWRMLIGNSDRSAIPPKLIAPQRAAMPIVEFIQALDDPELRLKFANNLLIEAIWRQDDSLARQAHSERQIAMAILSRQQRYSDNLPNAALEAAVYGTAYTKRLMNLEFEQIAADHPLRFDALKRLICNPGGYSNITLQDVQSASALLYPVEKFAGKFWGEKQYELLTCGFDRMNGVFEWLVENGANPDTTNNLGQNFLHLTSEIMVDEEWPCCCGTVQMLE